MKLTNNMKGVAIAVVTVIGIASFFWKSKPTPTPTLDTAPMEHAALLSDHHYLDPIDTVPSPSPLERTTINDYPVFLQRPATTPKGIFFGAHGCSHSATDWWHSSNICPECIGLPEEQAIVNMLLEKYQFLVVVMSSVDRNRKCWGRDDAPRVASVLKSLSQEHPNIPVIAFGASSGGGFVGHYLPPKMPHLTGFISQIMAAPPPESSSSIAVYITMDRDFRTDQAAHSIVESYDHPSKQIRLPPLAIDDDFFRQRITTITLEQSQKLVQALKDAAYLDPETLHLNKDPRKSDWRNVLRPHVSEEDDSLKADRSPISEVMNVAWAKHELARDGVEEAIDFILQQQEKENAEP